jgi:hypothetical protein
MGLLREGWVFLLVFARSCEEPSDFSHVQSFIGNNGLANGLAMAIQS